MIRPAPLAAGLRALTLLIAVALPARAEIAIETNLLVEANRAFVSLYNKGDEGALDVVVSAELANAVQRFPAFALAAGERRQLELAVPPDLAPHGTHPVTLRFAWRDRNGWPLSGVNLLGLVVGQPSTPDPGFEVVAGPLRLTRTGSWRIDIVNLDGRPRRLRVRVVAPRELVVEPERFEQDLGPDGARHVLHVREAGALAGSRYPVFVLVEIPGAATVDARAAMTVAEVQASTALGALRLPLLVLAGVLVLGAALHGFASRLRLLRTEALLVALGARFGDPDRAAVVVTVAIVYAVLVTSFPPAAMLLDTTPTGGDTPAHNYLVSHLAESLRHGSVISWAGGWWAGFPMFQFYFPLPYVAMALGSWLLPANVAFKVGAMAGIWALPVALWVLARRSPAVPRLAPALAVAATLPILFVDTHSMWGVNVRSTFAGMIANSWSFALFCAYLGHALADVEAGRPRRRTALLMAALCLSHFFTTLVAAASLWLLLPLHGRNAWRRLPALALPQAAGLALAGFWLLPLIAKTPWSVEFGGDWDAPLLKSLPAWAPWAALPAIGGLFAALRGGRLEQLLALMLAAALGFYQVGGRINASFPNVRFWPFLFFAFVMLAALGLARLAAGLRSGPALVVAAAALGAAALADPSRSEAAWYGWNMRGAESMPAAPQLAQLAGVLRGTPGRFVSEQGASGRRFGSDRVFESFPATIGKPFLAGGIVNSATGALFAYTVQCELSQECAGYPKLVSPPAYDPATALRHLDLFSVSHVIAHSAALRRDLALAPGWQRATRADDYEVFARAGGATPLVEPALSHPLVLRDPAWKERAVEWFAQPGLLATPVVFPQPGATLPAEAGPEISLAQFAALLAAGRSDAAQPLTWSLLGPFVHDPGLEQPLDWNPLGRDEASLRAGQEPIAGRSWRPVLRSGAISLDALLNPVLHILAYAHVALHAPRLGPAELHLAVDDEAEVYWNGRRLGRVPRREPSQPERLPVVLAAGRNDLLLKIAQRGGGAFFSVRVADPGGAPIAGLQPGAPLGGDRLPEAPVTRPARHDCRVDVTRFDDREVRFATDCPGQPHFVKQSYYPNWKATGADGPLLATPHFQLVYPRAGEVVLHYGSTAADHAGRALSALAVGLILGWSRIARRVAAA